MMTVIEIVGWACVPGDSIREVAAAFDLQITSDGHLKSIPGSRHLHLKRPRQSGTLEITHAQEQGRLWVCYHSNREGSWVPEVAPLFAQTLADRIGGRVDHG